MKNLLRFLAIIVFLTVLWLAIFIGATLLLPALQGEAFNCVCPANGYCDCPMVKPYILYVIEFFETPSGWAASLLGLISALGSLGFLAHARVRASIRNCVLPAVLCAIAVYREILLYFFGLPPP